MTLDLITQTCAFSLSPWLSPSLLIALREGGRRRGADLQPAPGAAPMRV